MYAELVLDAGAAHVVALAQRAVVVDEEFRHQEQRDATRAGGRVRQAGQDKMHDVVGEVLLAIGDEDLLAEDAVSAVAHRFGAGAQRVEVGAGLRLGQVHRAHPLAGNELRQIRLLQLAVGVLFQCLDGTHRQRRPDGEGHGAGIPHFQRRRMQHHRQALAAEFRRTGERVPAPLRPGAIGVAPARRHGDIAVFQFRSDAVANGIERRDFLGGEAPGLFQDGIHQIVGDLGMFGMGQHVGEPRHMLQREGDLRNGGTVHVSLPGRHLPAT